jgi:hypothetical protein
MSPKPNPTTNSTDKAMQPPALAGKDAHGKKGGSK